MKTKIALLILGWLMAASMVAQDIKPEDRQVDMAGPTFVPGLKQGIKEVNGEEMGYIQRAEPYVVYPPLPPMSAKEREKFYRLVYNIKKVLPLAREARQILVETGDYLETIPNKNERKAHMKRVEASIKQQYSPRIKKLTRSQGKLLIKLIDRETNNTPYSLIQAFLGPVRAGFYQAFSWVFGMSLKKAYDPNGVDRLTERVVRQVEAGQL